jgi:hypothetical protein
MKLIHNINSTNAPKNGYALTEPDVALISPTIRGAKSNGLRIHGNAGNNWILNGEFADCGIDNATTHFGEAGSYDIKNIFFVGCQSFGAKEEAFDAVIGEGIWYIDCEGDSFVAGHDVKNVYYVNCIIGTLKIKASQNIYLINSKVQNLIFEKQGTAGQGVGAGKGPSSVYVYNTAIEDYNPNAYASARINWDFLPAGFALPEVPEDVRPFITTPYTLGDAQIGGNPEEPTPEPNEGIVTIDRVAYENSLADLDTLRENARANLGDLYKKIDDLSTNIADIMSGLDKAILKVKNEFKNLV